MNWIKNKDWIKKTNKMNWIKNKDWINAKKQIKGVMEKKFEDSDKTETEWVEIPTPFIGTFNDTIDLYIKYKKDKVIFTDDGVTINNLDLMGYKMTKHKDRFHKIFTDYKIKLDKDDMIISCKKHKFERNIDNMIIAILELISLTDE